MYIRTPLFLLALWASFSMAAQSPAARWADSVYAALSPDQRIGQLFMVAAYSNKGPDHEQELLNQIRNYHLGGVIFFQGGPGRQVKMTNRLQAASVIPLLVGMDAEWGPAMRLDSVPVFPFAMTAGFVDDTSLVRAYGAAIGRQCARIGVHMNFAPVVDINTNPRNPIINARSFGEDPKRVTDWSVAFHRGQSSAGVLGCAKHFPGHGDTQDDSHKTLPTVGQSAERLRAVEWEPYRALARENLAGVMVGHLNVPSLDASGTPASLSSSIIQGNLRNELKFNGLVITDALNMKGVSRDYKSGDLEVRALQAGNDLLLFPEDVPAATSAIAKALSKGDLDSLRFQAAVKAVLMAKYKAGLSRWQPLHEGHVWEDLNTIQDEVIIREITAKSISVLTNRRRTIPLEGGHQRIAMVTFGEPVPVMQEVAGWMAQTDAFSYQEDLMGEEGETRLLRQLSDYDRVVVVLARNTSKPWRQHKLTERESEFIKRCALQNGVILAVLANPYLLLDQPALFQTDAAIICPENTPVSQELMALALFGGVEGGGSLPVRMNKLLGVGYGLNLRTQEGLTLAHPSSVGMNAHVLAGIDAIVQEGLDKGAYPGCQVLVARKGKVIYYKAFGYIDLFKSAPVKRSDIYDLASITKIAAGVPAMMHLYEEKDLDLDAPMKQFLPATTGTNKEALTFREILAHQGRLQPFIPFYTQTLVDGKPSPLLYTDSLDAKHGRQVTGNLFLLTSYKDSIYQTIYGSALLRKKQYKYSDLAYYFVQEVAEQRTGESLDELTRQLLLPLGAPTLGYYPLKNFPESRIAPTEDDRYFRNTLIRGYVHDPGAAMMGGVAGHAGMFSNAFDLAKLMQMYLNQGTYRGKRMFKRSTVAEFTACQYCEEENRRGIGFDKPQPEGGGPTCNCVSLLSFGHTGFTGTMAWADPEQEIVYIFLSNRVHPSAENTKLLQLNIRTRIQETIYQALVP